jgi:carboxypeptidase Taq
MSKSYDQLLELVKDVARLESVGQLLDWDQETKMPESGVSARAEQCSLVAGIAHERFTSPELGRLLNTAEGEADNKASAVAATNLREIRRRYDRKTKLPTDLVKETAHTAIVAKDAWAKARKNSSFAEFSPYLEKTVALRRKVADLIGYKTEPYDALMDEFEPGAKSAEVELLFRELVAATVPLLQRIQAATDKPDTSILSRHYERPAQERLSRKVAETLGFDFGAGRADVSTHPFCTTIGGPGDVRITTRYMEDFLPAAMFGTMHEVGHAMYEQGLLNDYRFTPMGEAVSLGIHESQSRMWENFVGRGLPFWECHYPALQKEFPAALGSVPLADFYRAINAVRPSLIRVEADELTYNLHIALRFEIERGLISGTVKVKDVPAVWNETFKKYLGIAPPTDREGCLQDIHWSMGAIGYFATYTLGNLYAAHFFEQARTDIPGLDASIRAGDCKPLLAWLRDRIHRHGQQYRAHELVQRVTGKPLSIQPFVRYATEKFSAVYKLA